MKRLKAKTTLATLAVTAFLLAAAFQLHSGSPHGPSLRTSRSARGTESGYGLVFCENLSSDKPVVRLAATGDTKSCNQRQLSIATVLYHLSQRVHLDGIILLGDIAPVRGNPTEALKKSFLSPYAPLIENGVPFYAVLGNHDARKGMVKCETHYPYFNMNGSRYHSKVFGDNVVEVFFLDSNTIKKDPDQIAWLKQSLRQSDAHWKVVAMHHPLFSTARRHSSDKSLIKLLEPIFIEHRVDLVLSGHNHIYERLRPIHGIQYITDGSGGELRRGDLLPNKPLRAAGNDQKNVALVLQFTPDSCRFTAYDSGEQIVDEGDIPHRPITIENRRPYAVPRG